MAKVKRIKPKRPGMLRWTPEMGRKLARIEERVNRLAAHFGLPGTNPKPRLRLIMGGRQLEGPRKE
jgi:hypothetical protein